MSVAPFGAEGGGEVGEDGGGGGVVGAWGCGQDGEEGAAGCGREGVVEGLVGGHAGCFVLWRRVGGSVGSVRVALWVGRKG